jgi:hypothetical protein
MKTISTKTTGLKVNAAIKAGGIWANHNRGLAVRSTVKAGGLNHTNHSRAAR